MPTTVTYFIEATNLDYLMPRLRLKFGDLDGSIYSDTTMRTALVYGVQDLQRRWSSKYQTYSDALLVDPQPDTVPAGYVYASTVHGYAFVPSGLAVGSVFRNPFVTFTQYSPPIIQTEDEEAIILAAKLLLRRTQISSSAASFVSWKTEDIAYSNLGSERSLSKILETDQAELDAYFKSKIAAPQLSYFPIETIPGQQIVINTLV